VCAECTENLLGAAVGLGAIALAVVVLAVLLYCFRDRIKWVCMARLSSFFRLFTGARFKIVWTTYQIIGSVGWGVGVQFPEPFKSFTAGLQLLYFVAVGGECFELGYNYYSKLLLMTLWPLAVVVLGLIACAFRLSCTTAAEKRDKVKEHFASMFIVLCYI
jgi:hypothetical protein